MDNFKNLDKSKLHVYILDYFVIDKLDGNPANEVMENGCRQYYDMGLDFWISSGTLIGLHRDKQLIPFDTDIDVNVYLKKPRVVKLEGFTPIVAMTYDDITMQQAWIKDGVIFDTYFFYDQGDYAINVNEHGFIKKPKKFIDDLGTIEFNNFLYPTPYPINDFLEWRFGEDWQTPKTSKQSWEKDANHLTLW